MKKLFLICLAAFALIACGEGGGVDTPKDEPAQEMAKITIQEAPSSFSGYQSTATIRFNSTEDWRIEVTGEINIGMSSSGIVPNWLSIEPASGSAGDAEVTITVQPNYGYGVLNRKASILIYAGYAMQRIDIKQEHFIHTIDNAMNPAYSSTDFSQDGETSVLQYANVSGGEGINLVFMGDGFTDRLIADGTYDNIMHTAMEALFSYEPYKSFRHYFTCHKINVVSKDETIAEGHDTALKVTLSPNSTQADGDNQKVINHLLETLGLPESAMDNTIAFVIVNATSRHGTCHLFNQTEFSPDGGGFTVAYCSLSDFRNTVLHEGSHGFAKLDDEYVNNGVMTDNDRDVYEYFYKPMGWFKNVDITNDPNEIKWSHFLSDSRYASDDIGIFEGAAYCAVGAYRPSVNSMMNASYNGYGFNAPSREAIYHRIHKIAFGPEWEYDYEEFVAYDAKNIGESRITRAGEDFGYVENVAHQSPVIHKNSWRDEIEK